MEQSNRETEKRKNVQPPHPFAAVPLFAPLDGATLTALAHAARRTTYQPQQVVFLMGEPDTSLYIVEAGWLKAVKTAATGREQTMATFGPGALFNDIAVLAGVKTLTTVIALEPTILWHIPQAAMLDLVATHPSLAQMLISSLASRVIRLANLVEDLALRPVDARLARLILTQASAGLIERRRWATQAELAAQLGTVPDVLNRALRSLVEAGMISVDRRTIRIIDPAGLEARAQLSL